jgi:hypothetical protein
MLRSLCKKESYLEFKNNIYNMTINDEIAKYYKKVNRKLVEVSRTMRNNLIDLEGYKEILFLEN